MNLEDQILSKYRVTPGDPEQDVLTKMTSQPGTDLLSEEESILAKYRGSEDKEQQAGIGTTSQERPSLAGAEESILAKYRGSPGQKQDEPSIGGALVRGVRLSLNPSGVDPEEMKKQRTVGETVAEVGANIGTDIITSIGAGALAGAIAGSVVPVAGTAVGTAAGIGLAVWRALGYEDLMSRVEGKDFSAGRAVLSVAVEVNPLLKMWGKLAKGATQGGLQAWQALAYGADNTTAGVAGAVSGGIAALTHRRIAGETALLADPSMGKKGVQNLAQALAHGDNSKKLAIIAWNKQRQAMPQDAPFLEVIKKEGNNIFELAKKTNDYQLNKEFLKSNEFMPGFKPSKKKYKSVQDQMRQLFKAELSPEEWTRYIKEDHAAYTKSMMVEHELGDLARFILKQPGMEIGEELFEKAQQKLKAEGTSAAEAYDLMKTEKYGVKAVQEILSTSADTYGNLPKDPMGNTIGRFFGDIVFAARAIDRRIGTNLAGLCNWVSHAHNLHSKFMISVQHNTNELLYRAKKIGLNRNDVVDLLEAGEEKFKGSADQAKLLFSKAEGDLSFRSLFDDVRDHGIKNGLTIEYQKNYASRIRKDPAAMITDIRRTVEKAINAGRMPLPSVREALTQLTGVEIEDIGDVYKSLNLLKNVTTVKRGMGFEAQAAFERGEGAFPELLREKDIGRVILNYANNTSKAVHLSPAIRALETQIPILDALGYKQASAYLSNRIEKLSGKPSEWLAWTMAAATRYKVVMDEVFDQFADTPGIKGAVARKGATAAKFVPDFVSWSMAQIYPNFLGWSPRANLRNLTQTIFMLAPEVGGGYGYRLTARAAIETFRDLKKGVKLEDTLSSRGYAPGKFIGEGMDVRYNSMRNTAVGRGVELLEKWNDISMSFYSKTEIINRYITWKAANGLANDIIANKPSALNFVKKLDPGAKSEIHIMLRSNKLNEENLTSALTEHLLAKTIFNYGAHAGSEAQQTFGRFFSMFTKWPTMVYGDTFDIISKNRTAKDNIQLSKGMAQLGAKYLAPWFAVGMIGMWLNDTRDSPRKRALIGQSLMDWHPYASLKLQPPPALEIIGNMGGGFLDAVSMDFESAGKKVKNALLPITPGMGIPNAFKTNVLNILMNKE